MFTTKRILLNILLCLIAAAQSNAQTAPMTEINQHVQALLNSSILKIDSALREEALAAAPDYVQLKNLCQVNWSSIIDNFSAVQGGDAGKSMVISAFEGLDAGSYMTALERLAEKFRLSQISKPVMVSALRSSGRMQAFLADNYQQARVQALLNDLKPRFAGDAATQTAITDILSGQTKTDTDDIRKAYGNSAEGNIPKVLLPP